MTSKQFQFFLRKEVVYMKKKLIWILFGTLIILWSLHSLIIINKKVQVLDEYRYYLLERVEN